MAGRDGRLSRACQGKQGTSGRARDTVVEKREGKDRLVIARVPCLAVLGKESRIGLDLAAVLVVWEGEAERVGARRLGELRGSRLLVEDGPGEGRRRGRPGRGDNESGGPGVTQDADGMTKHLKEGRRGRRKGAERGRGGTMVRRGFTREEGREGERAGRSPNERRPMPRLDLVSFISHVSSSKV